MPDELQTAAVPEQAAIPSIADFKRMFSGEAPSEEAKPTEEVKEPEPEGSEPEAATPETVELADGDEPDDDEDDEPDEAASSDGKKGKSKGFQKRLAKKDAQWQARLDKETRDLRAELEAARRGKEEVTLPSDLKEPVLDECESLEDYAEKKSEYRLQLKERERAQKAEAKAQAEEQEKLTKSWDEAVSTAKKELTDWETVMSKDPIATEYMKAALVRYPGGLGPFIAHHLNSNPAEALEISKMNPMEQVLAISEIGSTIKAERKAKAAAVAEKPKPQPSLAPKPARTISSPGPQETPFKVEDKFDGNWKRKYLKQVGAA